MIDMGRDLSSQKKRLSGSHTVKELHLSPRRFLEEDATYYGDYVHSETRKKRKGEGTLPDIDSDEKLGV